MSHVAREGLYFFTSVNALSAVGSFVSVSVRVEITRR